MKSSSFKSSHLLRVSVKGERLDFQIQARTSNRVPYLCAIRCRIDGSPCKILPLQCKLFRAKQPISKRHRANVVRCPDLPTVIPNPVLKTSIDCQHAHVLLILRLQKAAIEAIDGTFFLEHQNYIGINPIYCSVW